MTRGELAQAMWRQADRRSSLAADYFRDAARSRMRGFADGVEYWESTAFALMTDARDIRATVEDLLVPLTP